jgi:CheY-like chemotaxis protein
MSNPRFLVVDDATFTRDLIKKTLRNVFPGCEVFDSPTVRKAQAMLKQQAVDVILSDWEMPEVTGEEFLKWIRADEALAKTPFIIVSSRGEREFVAKAIQAGVNDYLGKPFTPDDLLQKVGKQLKRIGKSPTGGRSTGATQGIAFASVDALGAKPVNAPATPKAEMSSSAALLMGQGMGQVMGQAPKAAPPSASTASGVKAQAQLRFASGADTVCVVRNITLKGLQGFIRRDVVVPTLFEQTVISIVSPTGGDVARLNGYVENLAAAQAGIDCESVRIGISFVDDDPKKLEHLSLYIASL